MCLSLFCLPPASVAQAESDAALRVDLAGRQRMLTQRMAAASCLALLDVGGDARRQISLNAYSDFDAALLALQFGNARLGLRIEPHPGVLSAFEEVATVWRDLGPAVQQLANGDQHSVVVQQLLDENMLALALSNTAVQQIVRSYGDAGVDVALANAINIAGRQRMLSQKMMKEACFLAAGLDAEQAEQDLAASMTMFEDALRVLRIGNPADAIAAPPSPSVRAQLENVSQHWATYSAALKMVKPASRAGQIDYRSLEKIAQMSDEMLAEAHKAVQFYVESAQTKKR